MPGTSPGPSIKKPDEYEALKSKGYSKSKAAAISNADAKKVHAKQKAKHNAKKRTRKAPPNKKK